MAITNHNPDSLSIKELTSNHAKLFAIKVSLILLPILISVCFALTMYIEHWSLNKVFNSISGHLQSSLQLGDRFELQQALGALISSQIVQDACIFDGLNSLVAGSFGFENSQEILVFHKGNFLIQRLFQINLQTGQNYKVLLRTRFPFNYLFFALILGLSLSGLLYFLSKSNLNDFGKVITTPLSNFPKYLTTTPGNIERIEIAELDFLFNEITKLQASAFEVERLKLNQQKNTAILELASQVAHDIRSPLSALNMMVSTMKDLPEDKRLILRGAVQRINDIANGLLKHGKDPMGSANTQINVAEPTMLVALLDNIVSEKRVQYRDKINVEIEGNLAKGYGLFSEVNPTELSRVISNLVNNSIEAFERSTGLVSIGIQSKNENVVITVEDNGKGIPPHILSKLGERGVTYGKDGTHSGSGLGISHARDTIEAANGIFEISSIEGSGTTITMTLPKCETPNWFVEQIQIFPNQVVVSIDDDQSIHQIWSGRFASAISPDLHPKHLKFTSIEEFETWAKSNQNSTDLYLIDYEFIGQKGNGLETIERHQIQNQSLLVTSRYEEPQIQTKAQTLKLKILPKGLAPFVPITLEAQRAKLDAVLIDDDPLVHMTWNMIAETKNKNILCFATPEEFYKQANKISATTSIYIDVDLADGKRGEDVAKDVFSMGFTDIFLTTGYEASTLTKPDCVREIVGKAPAF